MPRSFWVWSRQEHFNRSRWNIWVADWFYPRHFCQDQIGLGQARNIPNSTKFDEIFWVRDGFVPLPFPHLAKTRLGLARPEAFPIQFNPMKYVESGVDLVPNIFAQTILGLARPEAFLIQLDRMKHLELGMELVPSTSALRKIHCHCQ